MTKEDYKLKLGELKTLISNKEDEIRKSKETILQIKTDLKIKKNDLKNIHNKIKILKSQRNKDAE